MKTFWPRFAGNPRVIAGLVWLGIVVIVAAAAPLLASSHPFEIVAQPFLIPSAEHPSNTLSPLIVTGSLIVVTAILIESALSFRGLGALNLMSWGFMVGAGRSFLRDAWWLVTIPGIAILLTVLSINLVGEGLNDALNPRLSDL